MSNIWSRDRSRLASEAPPPRWLWPAQIAVGAICIALSILIAFSPQLGQYVFLFLAGAALIILGGERVAEGIRSHRASRSSRLINIVIGGAIIGWIGSGFFYPEVAIGWLTLFFGFGLLANGAVRIIDGLKKKSPEPLPSSPLVAGVISITLAIAVLAYPALGFVLLIIMTAVAMAVSGIQIIAAGVRGARRSPKAAAREEEAMVGQKKRIWKSGSWFRDDHGRYLLFRGVNFASRSKLPPYLPIAPLETRDMSQVDLDREVASTAKELDLLQDLGFNIVRLLISWKALEPRPNPNLDELLPEGRQYLTFMKEIIDELYARNLLVILDFHQDIANEVYGGDGFPDWALAIDSEHALPEASDFKDKKWMIKYVMNKSLKHTLRSFWRNDLTNMEEGGLKNYPVRTHLEKTIGQSARFFRSLNSGAGHPAILGIEPFNEPHPVGIPKEQFEQELLVQYYRNVDSEVRKFDPDAFIFIEPRVDWTMPKDVDKDDGITSSLFSAKSSFNMGLVKNAMVEGKIDSKQIHSYLPKNLDSISTFGRNGVLSFHYYDMRAIASSFLKIPENTLTFQREWPIIFGQLVQSATERGLIPFLTEFGAFQGGERSREYMNLQFEQVEAHLLNSTYWNYDLYHTEYSKDNWNLEDYSLLGPGRTPRNIDVVARPYPLRSSAKPALLVFDIESKYATIVLKGRVVEAPTVIYVPSKIHYGSGFAVWGTGKQVEWDRENQLLSWRPARDQEYHQIIICPAGNLDLKALPEEARRLGGKVELLGTFS